MTPVSSRFREGAQRFAERRKREDDAPRLNAEVPTLRTLRLEVEERRGTSTLAESKHVRHIIVDRAPALFVLPCGDSMCHDGGHDITHSLIDGLRRGRTEVEVEDQCMGSIGTATCGRIVRVIAKATYAT